MSADEFDPFVERAFARSPRMADEALFAAGIEAKLASSTRLRTLALTLAGLTGGIVAVRQSLSSAVDLGTAAVTAPVRSLGQGLQNANQDAQLSMQPVLDQVGLSDMVFGSMGGMSLFWIGTAALVAVAIAGAMKLSQEI
ncbi:hypothetical protein [Brevundimonas variabilis]|uniref:Uncharacterized protein n=1 Tax=Brevundimonas variabilis TaxID=74312 RepID=A0A7W9CI68_9CAUL|nr:hypothetical protein [Brevundimonas variabilis]MBB5745984.1 hypothetical protein [Brevundimonas variabilis]